MEDLRAEDDPHSSTLHAEDTGILYDLFLSLSLSLSLSIRPFPKKVLDSEDKGDFFFGKWWK